MEVYLDNSATTKPYDEVVGEMADVMTNCYGNPSALHLMGKKAEDRLNFAREQIASTLFASAKEIIFTSGGTEGDNLAIIGCAMANKKNGRHIITQKTEHMAVLEAFKYLEEQGFEVYYADVSNDGKVSVEDIKNHLREDTVLVSIMHVNNENGAIMPISEISSLIDHKKCFLHVDAVQSYGKIPINVKNFGADMITVSSHKIHGPNGVGALYVKNGVRLLPVMLGGKQESGMRSGTENLAGICAFAKASEIKFKNLEKTAEYISNVRKYFISQLLENLDDIVINSPDDALYAILNVSFTGVKSEVLLHVLESNGIYVSTGSACNSKKKLSYVLKSMGIKDKIIDSAIRFSFCEFNTKEEMDYCVRVLKKEVPVLRKIMR